VPAPVRAAALLLTAGEPVSTLTTDELGDMLVAAIPGIAFLLGHSRQYLEGNDIDAMAEAVAEMVHRRFARLNWAEISHALRRGASGEWPRSENDVLLVSLPHITHWLTCYCKEARAEAQLALQAATPVAQLPAPRIDYVGSVIYYVTLAKAGALPSDYELDFGNVLYTWLKEAGAFNGFRTGEQYKQMQQEETDRLLAVKLPESGAQRREYTSFINALQDSGELPDSHPLSRSVVNACKKRLLREWLWHHAKAGTNIVDFLTERLSAQ
jgi:hypothetical protein